MKNWLDRTPRTARDLLYLIAAAAVIWLVVGALPGTAGGFAAVLGALSPFAGGIALAYVLDIPTRFYAEKLFRGKRAPAIVLAYLTFIVVLAAVIGLILPQLVQSISTFVNALPGYLDSAAASLGALLKRFNADTDLTATLTANLENSGERFQETAANMMSTVAGAAAAGAAGAAGRVLDAFVSLAASIYLLAEKEPLLKACRALLRALFPPHAAAGVLSVFQLANRTFSGYIGGQLLDALLVGIETFIAMLILRLNYAPMIAVLVAVTNIIPIAGPYIGAIPSALLLLLSGEPLQALIFCILILVVQQVDGNFIAPRILGGATGISGLWVLVAIIVGGGLFGIVGMVVGVPVMAVLAALLKQAVGAGLTARGLDPATGGESPLPDPDADEA
ncbi:MAG TPA: AI-2E family transporter [Candidatus Gemmiger stercoripullorum]|nr:AI-2E family transporter [Candidatus Gemmiger stercoripullorum]